MSSSTRGMDMKIRDLMTEHSATCTPDQTVEEVSLMMWNGDFGAVPVIDDQQRITGMITDRDIAMACALQHRGESDIRVGDVIGQQEMTTCQPEDDVERVLEKMEEHKVRRLPVVDDAGHVEGIVSLADIIACSGRGKRSSCPAGRLVSALRSIATPHIETGKRAPVSK